MTARGLLIDLDGVLYARGEPIAGAPEAIGRLAHEGVPHLFLTNTTSRPRSALVEKLAGMGVDVAEDSILTPPVAADRWLAEQAPGPAALFVPDATTAEFQSVPRLEAGARAGAASVVLGDLGEAWSFAELNRAFRLLMDDAAPPLVALGMTRYWRAPGGLQLDVGPFVAALEYATGREAVVLGKPSAAFFETAASLLGLPLQALVMIGDDVVGDVGGAQRAGAQGVLVRTGKYRPGDADGDVRPDAVLDSIAELPEWWGRTAG